MTVDESKYLKDAKLLWDKGRSLEAGQIIFNNIPTDLKPKWSLAILDLAVLKSGTHFGPINTLQQTGREPQKWNLVRDVFSSIRKKTLELEQSDCISHEQKELLYLLYLAENVAKVIYNATKPLDEFDLDSGAWIVSCLKDCIDISKNDQFAESAGSVLSWM
ncbi:hypothetical protein [Gimesia maris]|uniref:hypothetical protein n=1 Tax=Gimesia maris TaxID=122 RepID=UPI0032EF336F